MHPLSKTTSSHGSCRPGGLGLLVCATLLSLATPASAAAARGAPEALTAARARFADLDFEGALRAFEGLAADPSAPATLQAAALTGRGLCLQVLGRPKEARAAFLESLAIDPKQTLPEDTSPKLRRPFLAARKLFQEDYAPRISLDRSALAAGSLRITSRDPLGLIDTVEVLLSAGSRRSTLKARARGDGTFEADLASTFEGHGRTQLRAFARNIHDIEIASLGTPKPLTVRLPETRAPPTHETKAVAEASSAPPDPTTPEPPAGPAIAHPEEPRETAPGLAVAEHPPPPSAAPDAGVEDRNPPKGPGRPLAYGLAGGAAATLGGAIALGLSARSKARAFNGDPKAFASQADALATGRAARSQALGANLLYGGAAILAGSAALFYFLWHPAGTASPEAEPDPFFALAPTPEGAVFLLGGSF